MHMEDSSFSSSFIDICSERVAAKVAWLGECREEAGQYLTEQNIKAQMRQHCVCLWELLVRSNGSLNHNKYNKHI